MTPAHLFIWILVAVTPDGVEHHTWQYAGRYASHSWAAQAARELGLGPDYYKITETGENPT